MLYKAIMVGFRFSLRATCLLTTFFLISLMIYLILPDREERQPFKNPMTRMEITVMMDTIATMNRALEVANITYFLYGSSLLGSFRHHGQVPWDDSFSVMVNGSQRRRVDHTLRSFDFSFDLYAPEKSERKPWRYFHKIIGRTSLPQHPYGWPNVAIYFFAENATHIWNEFPEPGEKSVYRKDKVFPLRQRPFSSLRLYTPCDPRHVINDHELEECRSSRRWHKFERPLPTDTWLSIPCEKLWWRYPFVYRIRHSRGWHETLKLGDYLMHTIRMGEFC